MIPIPIEPPTKRQPLQMRDYQAEAIASVRRAWDSGINRPLVVLPTGGGKTVIFNLLADQYCDEVDPGGRVLMIAHRMELVAQAADKYRRFCGSERKIGIISAKMGRFDFWGQITFAGKDSLSEKRMEQLIAYGKIGLLIIDEAHHAPARTYNRVIEALLKVNPNLRILGLTATPMRSDGQGLGGVFDVAPWNEKSGAAYQLHIGNLISQKYLVRPKWLAVKTGISLDGVKTSRGDYNQSQLQNVFETPYTLDLVVRTHIERAKGKQAICFTISVNGIKDKNDDSATDGNKGDGGAIGLARRFNEAGIAAGYIHGEMSEVDRRRVLQQFEDKEIEVICNCAVLTEGYDCPGIEVIHMVRPTKSDALYIQCMGRGLRPSNGHKAADDEDCLIFEYAPENRRNLEMIGFLMGIPDDQLDKIKKAQNALDRQVADIQNGEIMASFGFDGEQIAMIGDGLGINALAIITEELDYFADSNFNWNRVDDNAAGRPKSDKWEELTVLGLGESRIDGNERILVIQPLGGDQYVLYGLKHPPHDRERGIYYPWEVKRLRKGSFSEITAEATAITDSHANPVLAGKGKHWHNHPASQPQINKLLRSMGKRKLPPELEGITKGRAAELINQYDAIAAIEKYEKVMEYHEQQAAAQFIKDQQTTMEV